MFFIFRNFLVVLLVSLQWISPLVHAHINATPNLQAGLHIPELEGYSLNQDSLLVSAVTTHYAVVADLIISIDTGTKARKLSLSLENNKVYLPSIAWVFKVLLLAFVVNFSPHTPSFKTGLFISAHSSRAPPFAN